MNLDVKCIYCSCACNKTPKALDWGFNNLICYSACNAVHILEYKESSGFSQVQSLLGHKKLVTSIHWIKRLNQSAETELISTSADQTAIVWKHDGSQFTLSCTLVGHNNVVRNAASIYYTSDGEEHLIIATLSIDSSIKVWQREKDGEILLQQTISLGSGFALDAKFLSLPSNNEIILLISRDDYGLDVYTQSNKDTFKFSVRVKKHTDWVQSIDIVKKDTGELMVATASQEGIVRIFKIKPAKEDDSKKTSLKIEHIIFKTLEGNSYAISLQSVLRGHENWVYSARWHIKKTELGEEHLQLLSTSMDKSLIIWEYNSDHMWLEKVRMGDVGGNTMGFFGAVFSPSGETVAAHSHQGAIHIWQLNKQSELWQPGLSFGGHYAPVQDIDWDPDGEFVLSCSHDQTTRLHAPYTTGGSKTCWYEMARPQIHGYDMVCLNVLSRFQFISAGDEKVLRVFDAPRSFAETLKNLTHLEISMNTAENLAEGASIPSLGLSNKAVFENDIQDNASSELDSSKHPKDKFPDFYYTPTHLTAPPSEDVLLQNTLWPETKKLYGHPYEVYAVTSNHTRTLVASACKASKPEHAGITLWSTATWKQVGFLKFHSLTITQLQFSPNDQYLLSVSRDRMWALYKYFPTESPPYKVVESLDKKCGVHARIIWSCSWSFDSLHFATASRDKKVAVWSKNDDIDPSAKIFILCGKALDVEDSATAVSFAPSLVDAKYFLAIGLENGLIILSSWCTAEGWKPLHKIKQTMAHHLTVNRLKFSPRCGEAGAKKKNSEILQLASCSNDCHVKVYNIHTHSIT